MTAPPQRRRVIGAGGLSSRQLESEVSREVALIRDEVELELPTGRCRICRHPESRTRVNTLLGYGLGIAEILECVKDINEKRSKNTKITRDSVRNHKHRHFNVQAPTHAGYRRILERRRAQLSEEFGEASGSLLTGMAYLDVVAHKGWQNLIDDGTVVPYADGLQAQLKLEQMQREGAIEEQIAQMRRDVSLLQQAVKDVCSDDVLREISERIDELTGSAAARANEPDEIIDAEVVIDDFYDQDDDDDAYNPTIEADEGDSIEG